MPMTSNITNTPFVRSFRKGLAEIKMKDSQAVRAELKDILGVSTKQSLARYANGKAKTLDVDKARAIEEVFARYGVSDPWGPATN